MTGLPPLDPEILSLGLALGLIDQQAGGPALVGDWLSRPGHYVTTALQTQPRRDALVHFAETVLGEGTHTERDGVTLLPLFDFSRAPVNGPDIIVQISLDSRNSAYTEIGIAATLRTSAPITSVTDVLIPLYRASTTDTPVHEPFALLNDDAKVTLTTDLTLSTTQPAQDAFDLGGIALSVATGFTGHVDPEFALHLRQLHLPGATTSVDVPITGSLDSIGQSLLQLVLGVVHGAAGAVGGPVGAALTLLGLGPNPDVSGSHVPELPVADLVARGTDALRDWFVGLVGDAGSRGAWLHALAELLGGTQQPDGTIDVQLGVGPAHARIGLRAEPGPAGHLMVTPTLGLALDTAVGGTVGLAAVASVDVLTIDVSTGSLIAVPSADLVLRATGATAGTRLLPAGPAEIGTLEIGLRYRDRRPQFLLDLRDVDFAGGHHDVLDLSTPDAAVSSVLGAAESVLQAALGAALGSDDTAAHVFGLLGLAPTGTVDAIDAGALLANPLHALGAWWRGLLGNPAGMQAVLGHLYALLATAPPLTDHELSQIAGTPDQPWTVPILANVLSLDLWVDGDTLRIAPTVSFRVNDLAGGCTVIITDVRVVLVSLGLSSDGFTNIHFPLAVDFDARLRGRGSTQARLTLGSVSVVADYVGVGAQWAPGAGFQAGFTAPNLAIDTGTAHLPLALPTLSADGHAIDVPDATWDSIEALAGVLADTAPLGLLGDLATLTGWATGSPAGAHHLRLADLVRSPVPALKAWAGALATDPDLLRALTATVAHLTGGTRTGLTGSLTGAGTPLDPWLASLGAGGDLPALAVWLTPDGPRMAASGVGSALRSWRPGLPGIDAQPLAQAVTDDAVSSPDAAAFAAGRESLGDGFALLQNRWAGTDGLVARPDSAPAGLLVHALPDLTHQAALQVDPASVLPTGLPEAAAVLMIAIGQDSPWTTGTLLDLTTPGVPANAFTVPGAAPGVWRIALATGAAARLDPTADPSGTHAQAARLTQVIGAFAPPVVLVAAGGAGHAARLAADAATDKVTHLITLGTPWSPATFERARSGPAADALRVLKALDPPGPADPGDHDLPTGRDLVAAFVDAARGTGQLVDLEADRPNIGIRAGLTAVAVFGVLGEDTVSRAMTAVVAAGLAARGREQAPAALSTPDAGWLGVQVPLPGLVPADGQGVAITGNLRLTLGSIDRATATVTPAPSIGLDVAIGRAGGWLLGGPGVAPVTGSPPLELRRVNAHVDIGLFGRPSSAELVLHEGAALGTDWTDLHITAPPPGQPNDFPLLPEARAAFAAFTASLADEITGSAGAVLRDLLAATGVGATNGDLRPDSLMQLLHDPGAQLRTVLAAGPTRAAFAGALRGLLPALSGTGDTLTLTIAPLTANADLAARTLDVSAAGAEGLLRWRASTHLEPGARPTVSVRVGDPTLDAAALELSSGPVQARLVPAFGNAVPLWPTPDLDGLARFAEVALPAEAVRLVLEGIRDIDADVGAAVEALADALGLLGSASSGEPRPITAPVLLFQDPGRWLRGLEAGITPARVISLLDNLKPFLGVTGPSGVWAILPGLEIDAVATSSGARIGLQVDATAWLAGLAGAPPFAAALTAALTIPTSGNLVPSVELSLGAPDGPGGTTTTEHRHAVHLEVDPSGVHLLLRPGSGPDVELFPHPAGLATLIATGVGEVLAPVLNAVAQKYNDPDPVLAEIGSLVGAAGRGLAIATGTAPATFSADQLRELANNPGQRLADRVVPLLGEVVTALDPLLQRLPGAPSAAMSGQNLEISVHGVTATITSAPFGVQVTGTVSGLPVVGSVTASLALDAVDGLAGFGAAVGPASIDVAGSTLRPVLRLASSRATGWEADLGLGLDGHPPDQAGHRELLARWQEHSGTFDVAVLTTGASAPDTTGLAVATAAIEAVLSIVGDWVLNIDPVKQLLQRGIGAGPTPRPTIAGILDQAIVTSSGTDLHIADQLLEGWPGKLVVVARNLAHLNPTIAVGPFTIGIAGDGTPTHPIGLSLSLPHDGFLELSSGDTTLHLEVDASWIDGTVPPGVVVDLLRIGGTDADPTFDVTPGIEVNGVGLRLGKASGALIDAGIRLETVAVHLFGSVMAGSSGPVYAGGIQVELGGLGVPLGGSGDNQVANGIMHDAGGSGAPPRPAFSPAVAVQDHGSGPEISLRAGPGDGPWFMPIQRAFGPVFIDQVGLGTTYHPGTPRRLDMISVYLDAGVSLFGISASVENLRIGFHVGQPITSAQAWSVDVDGFTIASSIGGLSLAGGLRKEVLTGSPSGVQYLGMLKISYSGYGIDLFGGYAHPTNADGSTFASFFAFGVLHAPLGGPPAFFITGIGLGFGINRSLTTPTIDQIGTSPFLQALRASGPAPDPKTELDTLSAQVLPQQGEFWIAAGVSFTSFVLINGEILLTIQFGDGLEIAILGLARCQLPDADAALVSIELALLARFSEREGTVLVQAQLTENSWLLMPSVRLTGGFAFQAWWKGPNAGQFVTTIGGYHPRFHHDGYPVVPRVGLRWQPIDNVTVIGETYFALCSEAIMAGLDIEVTAHLGPAHAHLSFGGDGIVYFDPFWFDITVHAEVDVGITIWLLFGSVDIELSLGVEVEVTGPPIFLSGHFEVCGCEIPFEVGTQGNPADAALDATAFAAKYLRTDSGAQVIQASVVQGGLAAGKAPGTPPASGGSEPDKVPDGSSDHPFRVVPEFVITFVSTAPVEQHGLAGPGTPKADSVPNPDLGVAPMFSATLDASLTVTLAAEEGQTFEVDDVALVPRDLAQFPKGVWGAAQTQDAKTVPAGEMVAASDGLTLDSRLPDAEFSGARQIDYHQVELSSRASRCRSSPTPRSPTGAPAPT